jgi:hypothetical protein
MVGPPGLEPDEACRHWREPIAQLTENPSGGHRTYAPAAYSLGASRSHPFAGDSLVGVLAPPAMHPCLSTQFGTDVKPAKLRRLPPEYLYKLRKGYVLARSQDITVDWPPELGDETAKQKAEDEAQSLKASIGKGPK